MLKSELIDLLQDNIVISYKQRESVDVGMEPEKYGFMDGKIFAFKLIRDVLFYINVSDDMKNLSCGKGTIEI